MDIKTKYLEKLLKDKIFVDISTDYFEEAFFGFIINFNEEFLLLEKFTDLGQPDGITVLKREAITRIKWGGNEIENTFNSIITEERIDSIEGLRVDTLEEALKSVQNKFGYVTLYIENIDTEMCIIGEIEEIDKDTIVIFEFGTVKALDRKRLMISSNEITRIEAGGKYEKWLMELFKKKKLKEEG